MFPIQIAMPAQTLHLFNQRYRIWEESLGDSGRTIFSANDSVDGADVTIKEISVPLKKVTTTAHQEAIRQNFLKHARMLSTLEHPSLVRVRSFFSDVGRHYLVLEKAEGTSLASYLGSSDEECPALGMALAWLDQVLDAVNYLHNQSPAINNNCIEPRNLIVGEDGRIRLSAIGVADDLNGTISTDTCVKGDSSQTLNYKPLEEIWKDLDAASKKVIASRFPDDFEAEANSPSDVRSDIYSSAAVFYHLLTGHLPIDALERAIDLLDGKPDPLRPPNVHKSSLPAEISEALTKALSIRRDDRFSTPSFMRQVLKTAVARIRERGEGEILGAESQSSKGRAGERDETAEIGRILEIGRVENPQVNSIPPSLIEPVSGVIESFAAKAENERFINDKWPEIVEERSAFSSSDFSLSYEGERKSSGFGVKWIAATAVVIVLAGGSAFVLLRPDSREAVKTEQPGAASTVSVPIAATSPEVQTPDLPVPVLEENPRPESETVITEVPTGEKAEETSSTRGSQRTPRQASVKSTAPQKKKVTVDDLINDN